MEKYICSNCGFVYDPQIGDPENGIPPSTSFADLPSDWHCPVCYANKDQFDEL
ncbi:rubredoxin [candidate division KSB1 bacterium]|nr:rubredoxin [candidate division KSB1 bacterium]